MIIFKEIDKLEIGAMGDNGAMGDTLTDYKSKLGRGGLTFEGTLPGLIEEKLDGNDVPVVAIPAPGESSYCTGILKKYSLDDIATFEGGEVVTGTYSAPTSRVALFYSVKITGKAVDGTYGVMNMPKCLVVGKRFGNPNSDAEGMLGLAFGIKEMMPVNASGVPLPSHTFVETDVD